MTKLRDELNLKLEKILRIYILAHDAYLYTEYFHNPKTEQERNLVISSPHSSNLRFIMHLMFRSLVTEVSKLYKNSGHEKYSIYSFIESLSPTGHFRKIGISIEHINKWRECLTENQEVISTVLLLRDKVYAHTDDPLKNYSNVELSFKNIKVLLELAAEILKEIYRDVFNTDLLLDSPTFDRDMFSILELIAKAEKLRVDEIYQKYYSERT